uniref:Ig-like domain-containing protein n=1 Tax=Setaria digitata TaxID=48799 RepID=A0A915Q230_9BILA
MSDGGKYTCKTENEAGSADIDLTLKVLVPPSIDTSNIIGNPLAVSGKSIYLECPVTGIPHPSVLWYKDGTLIHPDDERFIIEQNNQTLGIKEVKISDKGQFLCVAENKGGRVEQTFNLEVLVPPQLEVVVPEKHTKRERSSITLLCPVKQVENLAGSMEILWYKDGRPIDGNTAPNIKITSEGQRLQIIRASLSDAGNYSCVALNRAGESTLDFYVEILCTHLASEHCWELETKHLESIKSHYALLKQESFRTLAQYRLFLLQKRMEELRSSYLNEKRSRLSNSQRTTVATKESSPMIYIDFETFAKSFPNDAATQETGVAFRDLTTTKQYSYYNYSAVDIPTLFYLNAWKKTTNRNFGQHDGYTQSDSAARNGFRPDCISCSPLTELNHSRSAAEHNQLLSDDHLKQTSETSTPAVATSSDVRNDRQSSSGNYSQGQLFRMEWNLDKENVQSSAHRHRHSHRHYHHQQMRIRDGSGSIRTVDGTQSVRTVQKNSGSATSYNEHKKKHSWGGKRLYFQTQWQPWDPDYSNEPWTSWYTYKGPT